MIKKRNENFDRDKFKTKSETKIKNGVIVEYDLFEKTYLLAFNICTSVKTKILKPSCVPYMTKILGKTTMKRTELFVYKTFNQI